MTVECLSVPNDPMSVALASVLCYVCASVFKGEQRLKTTVGTVWVLSDL